MTESFHLRDSLFKGHRLDDKALGLDQLPFGFRHFHLVVTAARQGVPPALVIEFALVFFELPRHNTHYFIDSLVEVFSPFSSSLVPMLFNSFHLPSQTYCWPMAASGLKSRYGWGLSCPESS